MDDDRIIIPETGTGGPESDAGNSVSVATSIESVAGAIDPDAARNAGTETGTDDFTASFAEVEPVPKIRKKWSRRSKGTGTEEGKAPLEIDGLSFVLVSIHEIAFAFTRVPELQLDEKEAKEIAKAAARVGKEYEFVVDPKTAAWINLGRVVSQVYGTRAVSYYMRTKAEAAAKKPPQPSATVHPIRPENVSAPYSPGNGRNVDPLAFDPSKQKPIDG